MENTESVVPARRGRPPRSREIDLSSDIAVIDASGSPEEAEKPAIDPSQEVELSHVATGIMPLTGAHALTVGGGFTSGFKVSGIVRRLTMQTNGIVRVIVEIGAANEHFKTGRYAMLFVRDWDYVEPMHAIYREIDERTALGT